MRDWDRPRRNFIEEGKSLRQISEETGIPYSTLANRAKSENWRAKREELLQEDNSLRLERLIEKMAIAPRARFGIPLKDGDRTEWDLEAKYRIDPEEFLSMGKATPFAGTEVYGRCLRTVHNGRTVWEEKKAED